MIRPATQNDLPALITLEHRCFVSDRLHRRNFIHFITRAHATLLVAEQESQVVGYGLVLFRRGGDMARIYSIAVDPSIRKAGWGMKLLVALEKEALTQGSVWLRLETRPDSLAAINLYHRMGYRPFDIYPDYYEDHCVAMRMEKCLVTQLEPFRTPLPYIRQSLPFTCGPASLMMAMGSFHPTWPLDRSLELQLWRESTTIFMTSGHGGCGPHGLACAAFRRGFDVKVYTSGSHDMFVDSVRSLDKKNVIRLVQENFIQELLQAQVPLIPHPPTLNELQRAIQEGWAAVILISAYRLSGDKAPHWVAVAGMDERFIYIHEPFYETPDPSTPSVRERSSPTDCMGIPIAHATFNRMVTYGRARAQAAILIRPILSP